MYCLLFAGAILYGHQQIPAQLNGAYAPSYDTSYCRAADVHCTPQAPTSSILNRPSGHGYSVTYNYGLQPQPGRSTWSSASSSYNYGGYRIK